MSAPAPADPAPSPGPARAVVFTRAGLRRGARLSVGLSIGLAPFGLVVGVVAGERGLSLAEAVLMSALVYAGASQLLALELWAEPAPVLGAALAALAVNLRMAPMGAALAPWLERLRGWRLWGSLATLTDHSFALGAAEIRAGGRDAGLLLGLGSGMWLAWVATTAAGHALGAVAALPRGHPLFFAATATFVAIAVPFWRGPARDLAPWALSGSVALALHLAGAGPPWPLLAGALCGAGLAAWREERA